MLISTQVNNGLLMVNILMVVLNIIIKVLCMEINMHSLTSCMKTKTLLNSDTSIIEIEDPRFPTTFLNMDQDIMITLMDQEMPTALILDIITRPPQ